MITEPVTVFATASKNSTRQPNRLVAVTFIPGCIPEVRTATKQGWRMLTGYSPMRRALRGARFVRAEL